MKRCFAKVDEEVVSGGWCWKEKGAVNTVGSTAVVAVVGSDVVAMANYGDFRAVICRAGVAIPLSNDHKVKNTSYTNQYCPSLLGPVWIFGNKIKALGRSLTKRKNIPSFCLFPTILYKLKALKKSLTVMNNRILYSNALPLISNLYPVCLVPIQPTTN